MAETTSEIRKYWRGDTWDTRELVVEEVRTDVVSREVVRGPQSVVYEKLMVMKDVPPGLRDVYAPPLKLLADRICEALREAGYLDIPSLREGPGAILAPRPREEGGRS